MNKKLTRIMAILLLLLLLAWISTPFYLKKALIFQHPDIDDYSIFANREIKTGQPIPWLVSKDCNKKIIDSSYLEYIRTYGTVAFLIVHNDSILHEEYWDNYSDSSLSGSFSMAKSIVSLLIGCLVDEGKIKSLDEPITNYIDGLKDPESSKIRIIDLLTMSSGLEWDEAYSSATSITTQAYYGKDLKALVSGLKVKDPPGKTFNYQSCDTQLLSMIISKASGMHMSDYASLKLWKPLGAEHPALWSLDNAGGVEKAYCCFNSNARDFARIGQMLLDSGVFHGNRILSAEYIKKATTPASWLHDEHGKSCDFYGFQIWMLNYKGMKINYARGILGQYIFMIPDKKAIIVRLGHKRSDTKRNGTPEDIYIYLDAALELIP